MALVVRKIGNPNTDCNAHYSFSDLSNYNWLTDRVKELCKPIEAESLLALTLTKIYSHLWFKLFFHDCVRSGDWHLALSKTKNKLMVHQDFVSTVHFVVVVEKTTNPCSLLFHK